jgi:outer membrane protein insertion porin family
MEGVFQMSTNWRQAYLPVGALRTARATCRWIFYVAGLLAFTGLALPARPADTTNAPRAKFKISGYGFLGDLRLKHIIRLLESEKQKPEFFDADFIEDTGLILRSKLRDDGFLEPTITVQLTLADGRRQEYEWDQGNDEPLPRPLRAREVRFNIAKGVLYHFNRLDFAGLDAVPEKRARSYFVETGGLIPLKQNRVYSPDRFKRSVSNFNEALRRMGFQKADVDVARLDRDDHTGNVAVQLRIDQGPRFLVRSVRQEVYFSGTNAPGETRSNGMFLAYSKMWEQDFVHRIKTNYFRQGYPETSVDMQVARQEPAEDLVLLDLLARVDTGTRVRIGDVTFEGNLVTSQSLLQRRTRLKEGDWLNRVKTERGQYRLSRLGVFNTVELNYEPVDTNVWNVIYHLKEGKRIEVSPIVGFGSYDLLRAGVEVNQYNLWGLAHNQRLRLVQSFKSSSGDYTYNMPGLVGEDLDVFVNGSGLRREEISFTRLEYGGGAGVRKMFDRINTEGTFRYYYGILQATDTGINFTNEGAANPTVGELIADIRHDRRDNPLYPRKGYQLLGNVEIATDYLGGDANFQRFEFAASYHWTLNDSEWIHIGAKHGVVAASGSNEKNLPFTRRFFPGGENSVRGYQQGEAAPRKDGDIVGAETYISGSFEFEQGLTPKWSIVGFVDGVGFARDLRDYPVSEALFSAGGGLRWRTLIGPVRIEYGRNLNPRPGDPAGTLQFSLGVPF